MSQSPEFVMLEIYPIQKDYPLEIGMESESEVPEIC